MEATLNNNRTIFIGDVHGMLDELDALINALDLASGDRLVFLGDIVDKGPDQVGAVRRVGQLLDRTDISCVLVRGNHEDQHIRYRHHLTHTPKVARDMASRKPTLEAFQSGATDQDAAVLDQALPFWRCPELNILAVHGGIPGDMLDFPDHWDEFEHLPKSDKRKLEKIWRTRFIDRETGVFLSNSSQQPDDPFWAEVYDGRFGHVVFGHEVFMDGPAEFPHATGIDTGAVHGGHLTALVVTPDGKRDYVSVPGRMCSGTRQSPERTAPNTG